MSDIRLSIDLVDGTLTRAEYYEWRARHGVAPISHRFSAAAAVGELPWSGVERQPDPFSEQNRAGSGRTHGRISTYQAGCRCDECRDIQRRKQNARRARVKSQRLAASAW